jgi:hypothetical protein
MSKTAALNSAGQAALKQQFMPLRYPRRSQRPPSACCFGPEELLWLRMIKMLQKKWRTELCHHSKTLAVLLSELVRAPQYVHRANRFSQPANRDVAL